VSIRPVSRSPMTVPEHRKYLVPGLRRLLQFEAVATRVRFYQLPLIPGLLQTPGYGGWILEASAVTCRPRNGRCGSRSGWAAAGLFGARRERHPPDRRRRSMMLEQLEDFAELAAHPRDFVRMVPLGVSRGVILGAFGTFITAKTGSTTARQLSFPTGKPLKTSGSYRCRRTPRCDSSPMPHGATSAIETPIGGRLLIAPQSPKRVIAVSP
jgi:uncharacterized protein DUF5753